jgi:hypothetical protein
VGSAGVAAKALAGAQAVKAPPAIMVPLPTTKSRLENFVLSLDFFSPAMDGASEGNCYRFSIKIQSISAPKGEARTSGK